MFKKDQKPDEKEHKSSGTTTAAAGAAAGVVAVAHEEEKTKDPLDLGDLYAEPPINLVSLPTNLESLGSKNSPLFADHGDIFIFQWMTRLRKKHFSAQNGSKM